MRAGESPKPAAQAEITRFPRWNRSELVSLVRNVSLATWILPIGRLFAWVHAEGLENLEGIEPPVIFAPNHQSHFDVPVVLMGLPWKWRSRVAPGDVEGVLRGTLPPGAAWSARPLHQQPELLPVVVLLQCVPAAAARGRSARHAALRGRTGRRQVVRADLPRGQADRATARSTRSSLASG